MFKKLESFFKKNEKSELLIISIKELPDDILMQIFMYLSADELCKQVVLTCKRFNEIIDSDLFWTEKLLHDNRANRSLIKILNGTNSYEPKKLYFRNPFVKNLIKNPFGEQGFDDWCILKNFRYQDFNGFLRHVDNLIKEDVLDHYKQNKSRDSKRKTEIQGFLIESDPHGSKPFLDKNKKELKKFSTTHYICAKYQLIDLYNEGLCEHIIEKVKPKIQISDNYAARYDCGVEYYVRCDLFDSNLNHIDTHSFFDTIPQWSDGGWHEYRKVFENYPDNLRYILFAHGGKDTQYWAGNYGVKVTNSSVRLFF